MVRRIHTGDPEFDGGRPIARPGGLSETRSAASAYPVVPAGRQPAEPLGDARVEGLRERLRGRVGELAHRLADVRISIETLQPMDLTAGEKRIEHARAAAATGVTAAIEQAQAKWTQAVEESRSRLLDILSAMAPGPAAVDFSNLTAVVSTTGPAPWLRLGTLAGREVLDGMPAALPFAAGSPWYLVGDTHCTGELVLALTVRVLAQTPAAHLRVHVFDPRATGDLGPLRRLRSGPLQHTVPLAINDPSVFASALAAAGVDGGQNAELTAEVGARTLPEAWLLRGRAEGVLHLAVVLGYPYGADEHLHSALVRWAESAPGSGLMLLVQEDAQSTVGRGVEPNRLRAAATVLRTDGRFWTTDALPAGVEIRPDPHPRLDELNRVLDAIVASGRDQRGPTIDLAEVIADDLARPWSRSAATGATATVGRVGDVSLLLELRTADPAVPNILLGGAVGTGKSNLLLAIIYSLAAAYSPEELELFLLDYKEGMEFSRFGPGPDGTGWLPHVKLLALEADVAFGISVFRHLENEMSRRAELFKEVGAQKLDAYRERTGKRLPRLVLLVDEFQKLFAEDRDDMRRAAKLLDSVARQGRAYGVHVIMASQAMASLPALRETRESTFGQFPLRVSLRNTAEESQEFLARGNTAPADLSYRGEVIVNRAGGRLRVLADGRTDPSSNERGLIAFVDPDHFSQIQRRLWSKGHDQPPFRFNGRNFAARVPPSSATPEGLTIQVGRPVAFSTAVTVLTLYADPNQALAIVGADDHEKGRLVPSVIESVMRSAAPSVRSRTGRIVVLDGDGAQPVEWLSSALEELRSSDVEVEYVPRRVVARWLIGQGKELLSERSSGPVLLVGLELQRVPGMDEVVPGEREGEFDPVFSLQDPVTPRTVLQDIARGGGLAEVFLVGQWSSMVTLQADLGRTSDGVRYFVTVNATTADITEIAGPLAVGPVDFPRVGLCPTGGSRGDFRQVIPFQSAAVMRPRAPEGYLA